MAMLALVAAVGGAGSADAAKLKVPACALGTSAADLKGFYAKQLAKLHGAKLQAATAAYVYGFAPVSVAQTTLRFPENGMVSIAALTEPTTRTVVLPNHDTAYTVSRVQLSGGPRVLDVPDTHGRYYVCLLYTSDAADE